MVVALERVPGLVGDGCDLISTALIEVITYVLRLLVAKDQVQGRSESFIGWQSWSLVITLQADVSMPDNEGMPPVEREGRCDASEGLAASEMNVAKLSLSVLEGAAVACRELAIFDCPSEGGD